MNKYLSLLAALLLMAAPLSLVSCGDDDEKEDAPSVTPVSLATPAHKNDAMKLVFKSHPAWNGYALESIELTEDGRYILIVCPETATTRALSDYPHLFGNYSGSGVTYRLDGFGSITIDGDNVSANVTVIPVGFLSFIVPVTLIKPEAESLMATYLCRTWTVTNTRLRYPSGGAVLAKDFPGECNLSELVNYAKQYVNISDSFNPNKIVKGVTFTGINTFLINYADASYDMGTWHWNGTPSLELQTGAITYRWNNEDMGNQFMNGQASIEFGGSQCKLSLKATIDGKNVEVVWTMK